MATSEQYAAWIVKNKDKRGTEEFNTVASAYKDAISKEAKDSIIGNTDIPKMGATQTFANDPTEGMSFGQNAAAGFGKSIYDTGRGIGQLTGFVSQDSIDEAAQLDAPLMNTAGGITGNVAGNIGMVAIPGSYLKNFTSTIPVVGKALTGLGRSVTAPQGLIPSIGSGAILGATQPVTSNGSRLANAAIGGIAGGALPAAATALTAGNNLARVWGDDFAKSAAGSVINRFATNPADTLADKIRQGNVGTIPGYQPTLAEALTNSTGSDVGISTLQRTMQSSDPYGQGMKASMTDLRQSQDSAVLAALEKYILNPSDRAAAEQVRRNAAEGLYNNLPEVMNSPELQKILGTEAAQAGLPEARKIASNEYRDLGIPDVNDTSQIGSFAGRDIQSLYRGMRSAQQNINVSPTLKHSRGGVISDLSTLIDNELPDLKEANARYAEHSKLLNQSDIFQALKDTENVNYKNTGNEHVKLNAFQTLLENKDQLLNKAGDLTGVTTFDKAVSPEAKYMLERLQGTLRNRSSSDINASAIGSPTAQNLLGYDLVAGSLNAMGLPESWAGNKLFQTLVEKPVSKLLFSQPELAVRNTLAKAFKDPEFAAMLSDQAKKKGTNKLLNNVSKYQFLPAMSLSQYLTRPQ